jgi:hypothetical protein
MGAQGYQRLSKTHDFAGETISFRFRFTWASFGFRAKSTEGREKGSADAQKFGEKRFSRKKLFSPRNPLKRLKTAKEMFGKT